MKKIILLLLFSVILGSSFVSAQTINAMDLLPSVTVSPSPQTGSFLEGSSFEVPILINTNGKSVNSIDLRINFSPHLLEVIDPSAGKSVVGVWIEPPTFNNKEGFASYVGVIPNGLVTNSGLVGSITFKAKKQGVASISISPSSSVLLNDGEGTETKVTFGQARYNIISKPPQEIEVFSPTHPLSSEWYTNNNVTLSWEPESGVEGFSTILDTKPFTNVENNITTTDSSISFEELSDGLHYFHIKQKKNGVWGATSHFLIRIDTTPPAVFKPKADYILASVGFIERALISFITTDSLSGLSHFEVGLIDKSEGVNSSPVFVQTESPFQVALEGKKSIEVIVRAIDNAGNVRDASVSVRAPYIVTKFLKDNLLYILIAIVLAGFVAIIIHYLFGHHIIAKIKKIRALLKKEEQEESQKD